MVGSAPSRTLTDLAHSLVCLRAVYDKAGFDYDNVQYILRPEVLESVWYAWRISGDSIWQDRAYTAFKALKKCEYSLCALFHPSHAILESR